MAIGTGVRFEFEYSIREDQGEKLAKQTLTSVTALDDSLVKTVINGRIFVGHKDGATIFHRACGSYTRAADDVVDLDALKNMRFVWDKTDT